MTSAVDKPSGRAAWSHGDPQAKEFHVAMKA
jgi:hypothetical protein